MKKPVVLRIYKGDQLQGVKQFLDSQIVIGRPGEVQVGLDGEKVSLIHASIEDRGGEYFVCDLGSEDGTFKNGERVLDGKIESGDIIQIGEFRIEFYIGAPKPKATTPTAAETSSTPTASTTPPVATPEPVKPPPPVAKPVVPPPEKPVVAEKPAAPKPITPPPPAKAPASPVSKPASTIEVKPVIASNIANQAGPVKMGGLAGPRARTGTSGGGHSKSGKQRKATFAPPSHYQNVTDFIKPSKGTIVEVLVTWRERIISTSHFSEKQVVTIGSKPDCDIVLPTATTSKKTPLLRIDNRANLLVRTETNGELIRGQTSTSFGDLQRQNRMIRQGNVLQLPIEQGEMAIVELSDQISIIVRYVSDSPKPLVAPILDFTTAEATGVILAVAVVLILRLYMFLYSPPQTLADEVDTDPIRTAVIIVPPTPPPLPVQVPPSPVTPVETPPPVQVTKATPAPVKTVAHDKQTKASTNLTTKNDNGKSANAAPNKNKTGPRQLTSPKQGGAIKTAAKEGSQMQSPKRDVTKSGVFSAFASGGANNELSQSTTGSGELAGLANQATGRSGYGENRAGVGLGSAVKDTGQGGTGKSLIGINGGVGTQGRGSGNAGYGAGGLGNHAGVRIVTGGNDEVLPTTIDRDAIRRVILANLRVIRTCYERQLNRHPDLFGKLVLSWDIGDQGRVLATRVKSNELGNQEVADCIMERLKTWKFPDPPVNQVVVVEAYPFFFSN